ncbi:ZIP family metal transporter [Roseovarius ramblicola]|uniref:ZIP family metal transporter n=1 Tax=Roseovarius ramblicola TaxID=2022336 RepID=A0ABV5I383_9RHOB
MLHSVPPAVYASLVAGAVTTVGIIVVRRFSDWGRSNSAYFACFAAGVLIAVSFMHLIPKSLDISTNAPLMMLTGFLSLHVFNRFLNTKVCDRQGSAEFAIGVVAMIGIGFHSLIDGMIYSVTFSVSFFTGFLSALGMVLHEFPEGIVTFVLLLRGGFSERKSLWFAFCAAALTTPLGTLISIPWISQAAPQLLGNLLALSAGALFYVGATHLLPMAERESKKHSLVALVAGVATAFGIILSTG